MLFRNSETGGDRRSDSLLRQRTAPADRLRAYIAGRRLSDGILLAITVAELVFLVLVTPGFTVLDWVYVLQHLWVMGIAVLRHAPAALDRSLPSLLAVAASYAYPYAQIMVLQRASGFELLPEGGLVLVSLAAGLSLASLVAIGRRFGLRPALRGLATKGPYGFVRHPMYLAYLLGDIGYELQESNLGSLLLMLAGWASLLYRILAEERVLSEDPGWQSYVRTVRWRLLPGLW